MAGSAWKGFERRVASILGGERIIRVDWGKSAPDVVVKRHPQWMVDCKLYQKHAVHRLVEGVEKKYCKGVHDIAVVVTGEFNKQRPCVTMRLEDFMAMVNAYDGLKEAYAEAVGGE